MAKIIVKTDRETDTSKAVAHTHESTSRSILENAREVTGERVESMKRSKDGELATANTKNYIVDFIPSNTDF